MTVQASYDSTQVLYSFDMILFRQNGQSRLKRNSKNKRFLKVQSKLLCRIRIKHVEHAREVSK